MTQIAKFKWYWATRTAGLVVFLYEVFFDKGNPDRGTVIIAACGVMGFDKVARSESEK
jgi:hypothetical protein